MLDEQLEVLGHERNGMPWILLLVDSHFTQPDLDRMFKDPLLPRIGKSERGN